MHRLQQPANFWFGLVSILLAAALFSQTLHLPPSMVPNSIGSAFFPRLLLVAIAALGVVLMLRRGPVDAGSTKEHEHGGGYGRPLTLFAWLCAYVFMLPALGYYIGTALLMAGILFLFGERRWWMHAAAIGGFLLFVFVVFDQTFGVLFPKGTLVSALRS